MNKLISLTKRNVKLYFASKSNIFFSTLGLLILVGLHFIVFRKMNADNLISSGFPIERTWALWFSDSLMLSSLIPIGAVTISLTSLSQIVIDQERKIINDFYVAPIKRNTLLGSYLLSSFVIGFILLVSFVIFFEAYLMLMYSISFSLNQLLAIFGITLLSLILGNFLVLLIVSFTKREQAMEAIGTILGTLLGFVCGAYVPVGVLGATVTKVFTFLPFLPLTALARQTFFMNISETALTKQMISGELAKVYGYELYLGNEQLSTTILLSIISLYILVITILLLFRFKKMKHTA